jgi:hypothetical protein
MSTCRQYSAKGCIRLGKKLTTDLDKECEGGNCDDTECCDADIGICGAVGVSDGSNEPNWPQEYCWLQGLELDEDEKGNSPTSGTTCCKLPGANPPTCSAWKSNQCTGITQNGTLYPQAKVPDPKDGYSKRTANPHASFAETPFGNSIPGECYEDGDRTISQDCKSICKKSGETYAVCSDVIGCKDINDCTDTEKKCNTYNKCLNWDEDWVERDAKLREPIYEDYDKCCYDLDTVFPENKLICTGDMRVQDVLPEKDRNDPIVLKHLNDFVAMYDSGKWPKNGDGKDTAPQKRPDITNPNSIICVNCFAGNGGECNLKAQPATTSNSSYFGDRKCTPPPASKIPDMDSILQNMGMNQECISTARNTSLTLEAGANVDTMFGSAAMHASSTAMDNEMYQKGCGAFSANITNVINSQLGMSCNMNVTESKTNASTYNNANILIDLVDQSQATLDNNASSLAGLLKLQEQQGFLISNAPTKEIAKLLFELAMSTSASITKLSERRELRITNSTFTSTASTKLNLGIVNSQSVQTSLLSDFKTQATAQAEQSLTQDLGLQALNPNSKQLIQQNINNKTELITEIVNEAITKTRIDASNTSTISIKSSTSIILDNVDFKAESIIDLVLKSLNTQATALGSEISAGIITDVLTAQSTDNESSGIEDLQLAMGKTNADALKAGKAKFNAIAGLMGFIFIGIILFVAYKAFTMMKK